MENTVVTLTLEDVINRWEYAEQVENIRETTRVRVHADFIYHENFKKLSVEAITSMHEGTAVVDDFSKLLFHAAPDNVAFVGMYDTAEHKAYLHPLKPKWINNDGKKFYYKDNAKFNWKLMKKVKLPPGVKRKSFTHKAGKSPSHGQIASMYGVSDSRLMAGELIGFSIIKRPAGRPHEFNAQSQTMNFFKFEYHNRPDRGPVQGQDSYVTREWSFALMTLLARELA